jgi:hypothetical protein
MKKSLFILLASVIIGFFHGSWIQAEPVDPGCFPDQRSQFFAFSTFAPPEIISPADRDVVFQKLDDIFHDEITAQGGLLNIKETDDMSFGAFAYREIPNVFVVDMYKGVRYHRLITLDVYAFIACHEIGHHLGGPPLKRTSTWGSVEGQADYYATLKCMRRYYANSSVNVSVNGTDVPLHIVDQCYRSFPTVAEAHACIHTLRTASELALILNELSGGPGPLPSLFSHDSSVVGTTNEWHPRAQCRLDTYANGALCEVPWQEPINRSSGDGGLCGNLRHREFGRPLCWYAAIRD